MVALKERVAGFPRPLLSAYLSVNPAHPENQAKAYVIRLKDALKETGAPKELQRRVLAYVDGEQPRARTLAVFATRDEIFDIYRLKASANRRVAYVSRNDGKAVISL